MPWFGNQTTTSSESIASVTKRFSKFTVPDDLGTVLSIAAYCNRTASGSGYAVDAAIYADNAGAPGALVANSSINLSTNLTRNSPQWYTSAEYGTPPSLTPGGTYWIGVLFTKAGLTWYASGSTNQQASRADTMPFDDPFGSPSYANQALACYVNYDAEPVDGIASDNLNFNEGITIEFETAVGPVDAQIIETLNFQEDPTGTKAQIGDLQQSGIAESINFQEDPTGTKAQIGDLKQADVADTLNFEEYTELSFTSANQERGFVLSRPTDVGPWTEGSWPQGMLVPQKYYLDAVGTQSITEIGCWMGDGGYDVTIQLGIYSHDATNDCPESLLYSSDDIAVEASGRNQIYIPVSDLALAGGQYYWIAVWVKSATGNSQLWYLTGLAEFMLRFLTGQTGWTEGSAWHGAASNTNDCTYWAIYEEATVIPIEVTENINFQESPDNELKVGAVGALAETAIGFEELEVKGSIGAVLASAEDTIDFEVSPTPEIGTVLADIDEELEIEEYAAAEVITGMAEDRNVSIGMELGFEEQVTPRIGTILGTTEDSLDFEEELTRQIGSVQASTEDNVDFEESITREISALSAAVEETISFAEEISGKIDTLQTSVEENVAFEEYVELSTEAPSPRPIVSENVNFQEEITRQISDLSISVTEVLVFAEEIAGEIVKAPEVSVSEAIAFQEVITGLLGELKTAISENLNFGEDVKGWIGEINPPVLISIIENINFSEQVIARALFYEGGYFKKEFTIPAQKSDFVIPDPMGTKKEFILG